MILNRCREGKANLERRVIEDEQWYRMRHWECMRRGAGSTVEPASGWLFNAIANKHAEAMDNFPRPNVLPREEGDKELAKVLGSILPVILQQEVFADTYDRVMDDKLKTGTGIYGVFWNPDKLDGLGDISIHRIDVLNLYWESGITDIQQSRNVFYLRLWDNDLLLEQYPQLEGKLGAQETGNRYVFEDRVDTSEKTAVIDWYYKKRQGSKTVLHYCKFVGDTVLFATENEARYRDRGWYDHGLYPFVFDPLFRTAGSPCGFGYIDVMKDTQTAIDEMNAAMDENVKLSAKARYIIQDGAGINEKELADFGKDIVHAAGRVTDETLRPLQTAGLAGNLITYRDARVAELKEISGNRDVSQGGTTSGLTAASAIAALQEAGSKLSRDMLKSAYRAFAKECYFIIDLMRQFYDESRVYRITGDSGQPEYVQFSGAMLQPQPVDMIGGVELGSHEPVFDITVSAAKKSTFSRLSQNETAKECYQMGLFAPANADAALAVLDMMDFEGIEKVRERVQQNGTLYTQLQQAMEQLQKLSAIIDQQNGTNMSAMAGAAAQAAGTTGGSSGGQTTAKTATNGLGAVVGGGGNSLATQAAQRAMNVNNPNK